MHITVVSSVQQGRRPQPDDSARSLDPTANSDARLGLAVVAAGLCPTLAELEMLQHVAETTNRTVAARVALYSVGLLMFPQARLPRHASQQHVRLTATWCDAARELLDKGQGESAGSSL